MIGHKLQATESERIADDEIALLRERLAGEGFERSKPKELTTLADVAEATGLPLAEVQAHLSRMRAEAAFREKPRRSIPVVPIVGVVAFVAAVSVLWARTHQPDLGYGAPTGGPFVLTHPQLPSVTRPVNAGNVLSSYGFGGPEYALPVGFNVEIVGQGSEVTGQGASLDVQRMSYEAERDQLAGVLRRLINKTLETDAHPTNLPPPYRDMHGNKIYPQPGKAHYSITSWAGSASGSIQVPVKDDAAVRKIAEDLLSKPRQEQESALGPAHSAGVVSPPPGFKVSFAGRRLDVQEGPRWAFAPVPPDRFLQRMVSCLENARERDAKAPAGPWLSGTEARNAKPKRYRAEIEGPYGTFEIDLPASPGAFHTSLPGKLKPVVTQVQKGNSLAITSWSDSTPQPILNP